MNGRRGAGGKAGARRRERSGLDREVRDRLRRFRATAGLWVRRVNRGDGYERDADAVVPAGCYSRLFALIELLRRAQNGSLDPNARRPIRAAEHRPEDAPVLGRLVDEPELTLADCGRLMVLFGDSVAFGAVREALAAGSRHDPARPAPAPAVGEDHRPWADRPTTVREIGAILESAARGALVGPEASAALLEILQETGSVDPSLIPGFLPAGATMGRLRGASDGALADASVTVLGAETVVVSMCVVEDPGERSGPQLIGQLTSLLLEWAFPGAEPPPG